VRARYWVRQALRIEPEDPALRRLRLKLRLHSVYGVASWTRRIGGRVWTRASGLIGRPTRAKA
jgi:hypothetical protein